MYMVQNGELFAFQITTATKYSLKITNFKLANKFHWLTPFYSGFPPA